MDATEALKLLEQAKTYWFDIYQAAKDDLRFSIGLDHWSDSEVHARADRPCLVVNELTQYINQVVNDERQNTPSINVIPVGEGSDIETAKIFKGLIRNIEYRSGADEVYDTAGEYAVTCSIGFIRVDHNYVSEDSFLQELQIKRVQNPLTTFIDPASIECDGRDAEWAISLDTIGKEKFEELYPGREFSSFDPSPTDLKAQTIQIGEVFKKEYKETTVQMAEDGSFAEYVEEDSEIESKKTKRKLRKVIIRRYKFNGELNGDPLEESVFPGIYVPIVPVYGKEVWVDGDRHILSLIRQSKDAQRRLNHWVSKETEILSLAPIAPVMAPVGSTEDFPEWGDPYGGDTVLRYKMKAADGSPMDKPERLMPPPVPAGFINAMQGAKENIKETMGLYNASLGAKSNETSGVAIQKRQQEGDTATFHFGDNRNRSITQVGRVIVSAIPEVYDTDRVVQIMNEEDEPKLVGVNGAQMQEGQEVEHDLRKGQYDVRVTTGASYTTKRQEAAALLGDMVTANPALMGVVGDLLFKNMDIAGAEAIAARVKKTIPANLLEGEEGAEGPDPEKQQMMQAIQELQQQLQQKDAELQNKQGDGQAKIAEVQIKAQELELKRTEQQLKVQGEVAKNQIEQEKLRLENKKLDIELLKVEQGAKESANMPPKDAPQQPPVGIKLDTTGFQMMKTPEQLAMDEQTLSSDLMAKQQDMAQRQALLEGLGGIQQLLGALVEQTGVQTQAIVQQTQVMDQPMEVIRDANGVITGAQ